MREESNVFKGLLIGGMISLPMWIIFLSIVRFLFT